MAKPQPAIRAVAPPPVAWRQNSRNPLLPGEKVLLDGEPFVMPAVAIGSLSDHLDAAAKAEEDRDAAVKDPTKKNVALAHVRMLAAYVPIIHAALVRNYPNLPIEAVRSGMDPGAVQGAFVKLLRLSGFVELKQGEAERP